MTFSYVVGGGTRRHLLMSTFSFPLSTAPRDLNRMPQVVDLDDQMLEKGSDSGALIDLLAEKVCFQALCRPDFHMRPTQWLPVLSYCTV